MSRFFETIVLALMLGMASASASKESAHFLSAQGARKRAGVKEAVRRLDDEDDEEDNGQVGAFTPVSEAEEVEAHGDSVDDEQDEDSPDEDEPEEIESDTAAGGNEEATADEDTD
eukprot:CAMPEP_0197894374 /NCGR_PEP_ID=MMETSP1439-20131203/35294_1 /TAXON_ID=66791 /ORGANISM="Gonyaulax spinifera, Strain CCMP409" /LENGTH=114 /DNA_ID=CAMNT_0043514715 /DNA_START=73 /DNA_END=417 /DNA_ORIENTATION=-